MLLRQVLRASRRRAGSDPANGSEASQLDVRNCRGGFLGALGGNESVEAERMVVLGAAVFAAKAADGNLATGWMVG